jgi:hypothetical protein
MLHAPTISSSLSLHTIRGTESLEAPEIPLIAENGAASLCDKFPMFRDSVVVSKCRAPITKWHGVPSQKKETSTAPLRKPKN